MINSGEIKLKITDLEKIIKLVKEREGERLEYIYIYLKDGEIDGFNFKAIKMKVVEKNDENKITGKGF